MLVLSATADDDFTRAIPVDSDQPVVSTVSLHPHGKWLVTAGDDHVVRIWDLPSGTQIRQIPGHTDWVRSSAFIPNSTQVLTAGDDGHVHLLDIVEGTLKRKVTSVDFSIFRLKVAPNGSVIAISGFSKNLFLIDTQSGNVLHKIDALTDDVRGLSFSNSGKVIASGGRDGIVRLWSVDTGQQVAKELKKNGYNVKISEPDNNLEQNIKKFKPSVIFNALHGQFGEDGYIQTILETYRIPYTHSGPIASMIAMNKEISKKIFIKNKIVTPKYINYNFKKKISVKEVKKKIRFPVVIKPKNEGSSLNVFICEEKNFLKKLIKLKFYREILIEEFIAGREIQVAILGKKKLGAIELRPKRKFYDYKAKYEKKAGTDHIIPVDIPKSKMREILNIAQKAHNVIGCEGVTRSDFKYYNGKFYLLEINTQPGMTKLSLVPEIAKYKDMRFIDLLDWMLKNASIHK